MEKIFEKNLKIRKMARFLLYILESGGILKFKNMMKKVIKNAFQKARLNVTVATLCLFCTLLFIAFGCETVKNLGSDSEDLQNSYLKSASEIWDYPVKPGMEQWRQFKSMDEMYQACQLPENIIKTLDTESLVHICYNFPAYMGLFFYNSPQDGFNVFHSHFNGIRELLQREDAGYYMLEKYKSLTVEDFDPSWSLVDKGYFAYKYMYFETLLAQPQIVQSMDAYGRKEFLQEATQKFEMKLELRDIFGGSSFMTNAWVMARILHHDNQLSSEFYSPDEIAESLQSGFLANYNLLSIYQQAKTYSDE